MKKPRERETLIFTNKYIPPEHFNNKIGFYVNNTSASRQINTHLQTEIAKIKAIIDKEADRGVPISTAKIKEMYLYGDQLIYFYDFAMGELAKQKNTLADATYQDYELRLDMFNRYAPGITFSDITAEFLEEWRSYLLHVEGRQTNGIYHDLATVRKFYNIALARGIVSTHPFEVFKIKRQRKKNQQYLVREELDKLWQLYIAKQLPAHIHRTLYYFLWACYAGYRERDVFLLSHKIRDPKVRKEILEAGQIMIKPSKSRHKKEVTIDLYGKLKHLLLHPATKPMKASKSSINKDLAKIMEAAKINKHITFHSGRHTFGVVAKQVGVDTSVLQSWFGHESITTTQIYEHIVDELKKRESSKLDLL